MNSGKKVVVGILATAGALAAVLPPAVPSRAAMESSTSTLPAGRDQKAILDDLAAAQKELRASYVPLKDLLDRARPPEVPAGFAPALRKVAGLLKELGNAKPEMQDELRAQRYRFLTVLLVLGDADTAKAIDEAAKGTDALEALNAKLARSLAAFWRSKEASQQLKIVESVAALGMDLPSKRLAREALAQMANLGSVSGEVRTRALEAAGAVRSAGRPIELVSTTIDGKAFTTKSLRGKVILVDFWATWCGPCMAGLPHLKELYAKYKDQGLVIVGVSNDGDGDALARVINAQRLPWIQLWERDKQSGESPMHPLAKDWDVDAIPTLFLIDRNGVLRARALSPEEKTSLEELIPKLLAEKAAGEATTGKAPASAPRPVTTGASTIVPATR